MKFLKIILIIVLLSVPLISYGTGIMTSGDKTIDLTNTYYVLKEEPSTLNEWFYELKLSEKIEIYNNYKGVE